MWMQKKTLRLFWTTVAILIIFGMVGLLFVPLF